MRRLLLIGLLGVSVCTQTACTMAPAYDRPALPVATAWPVEAPPASSQPLTWRELFRDPQLQQTIQLALDNNRDLRIAGLNVEQARASYRIQRAGSLPSLDGSGSGTKSHDNTTGDSESYSANVSLGWELDLFGRLRSLNNAAKENFLASEADRNGAEISLIAAVADAWISLAADRDALALAERTYATRKEAYDIAEGRARIGALSDLALSQQKTLVEQAHGDVLASQTAVDQDISALTLLAGSTVPDALLPAGLGDGIVADGLPVGLPSEVLLARPDVVAAEHDLKAANANIGAARAAFFPSISLTGSAGAASSDLGQLFDSANGGWSYGARVSLPIFEGGANSARLKGAKVSRDIAVARYEKSIQSAFNDVNQALAVRSRIDERLSAQTAATDAALTSLRLSQARYDNGVDSYLTLLDAQRTAFASEQALINLRAFRASNLVALYRALANDQSLR